MRAVLALILVSFASVAHGGAAAGQQQLSAPETQTFRNPLLRAGPDPWVEFHDGYYYFMSSTGRNLMIRKTPDITDLRHAQTKVVWTPPLSGPYSHEIWAPELHYIQGKWYIYFAADAGTNQTHRLWVLENASSDPLAGDWIFKGKLSAPSDKWAIDATVFEDKGQLYTLWSGWKGNRNGTQDIYIARMANPWTIEGKRVLISSPHFRWEKIGDLPEEPFHVNVNEGPEILKHEDKLFLVFSASGCWTDNYSLGMLTATSGADLLKRSSWKKTNHPVFSGSAAAHAFGTGHNAFFKSPDGTQDWIIYHANPSPGQGCDDHRSPRAQPFTWNSDGTPDFGTPVPLGDPIPKPSGTPASDPR